MDRHGDADDAVSGSFENRCRERAIDAAAHTEHDGVDAGLLAIFAGAVDDASLISS
jgi:hypothetical protein